MKTHKMFISCLLAIFLAVCPAMMAQNSLMAPGTGSSYSPAPAGGPGGPGWGGPMGAGWNGGPAMGYTPVFSSPAWQNSGYANVVACGYDYQGIWRTIPMSVYYTYNGVLYNVTVLNAWDPWMQMWDKGVDVQAVNTSYYTHGNWYNFYVVLSYGTFYFNL